MNPIIRECVLVANVTGDHKWIGIARYLLRQLPVHLRQEAEFNLQMVCVMRMFVDKRVRMLTHPLFHLTELQPVSTYYFVGL